MAEIKTEVSRPVEPEADIAARDLVAAPDREVEVADDDIYDRVIAAAAKLEQYAKAQETILNIVIKRSFAGDWVCHDRSDTPEEQRKANLGAAGAERIALFLGVTEHWVKDKDGRAVGIKEWSDDKKHYSYSFEADFTYRGITRHAIGRVGTRDKFFGFAHGDWKPLDQVEEDDIRTAAFRDCVKKGVTRLFGLRNIPLSKLAQLGYDTKLVHFAEYRVAEKKIDRKEIKPGEGGIVKKAIQVAKLQKFEGTNKTTGKPWMRFDVFDKEGIKYACFANEDSKRIQVLQQHEDDQTPVEIGFKVVPYNDRENYQIEWVAGAEK